MPAPVAVFRDRLHACGNPIPHAGLLRWHLPGLSVLRFVGIVWDAFLALAATAGAAALAPGRRDAVELFCSSVRLVCAALVHAPAMQPQIEHAVVGVQELLSAPRAPTRGRPSPRGPPNSV